MFRNLKLKLTLTNVFVVAIIFCFVFSGIYLLMERSISGQSVQIMRFIATNAGSDITSKEPKLEKRLSFFFYSFFFYTKIDNNGVITETSPTPPFNREKLQILVNSTIPNTNEIGKIHFSNDNNFLFLKAPLLNKQGTILVFANTKPEKILMRLLFTALTFMGLIGLALALFGSLFVAERALIPIKKSWLKQKTFVADASHELRTPLAVMQTNLELVLGNPEDTVESQTKWLENIREENKRMTKLVEDLLLLARADSEQILLEMHSFSLGGALNTTFSSFEPVANKKSISLSLNIAPEINYYGDETRIKQLAVILIDNAIKYTNAGGNVRLEVNEKGHNVEILVSDTGEGIEEEHLDKIFQRFYRIDKARSKQNGGTGLGLAIAELIVKEHSGTIKVTSIKEKGTTFLINLPNKKY